jgi:1-deoxy-D-xylulose-5-phosphate reductoisomerase
MAHNPRRLAILGATGSIGQQALAVVRAFPERLQVVGLAAGSNLDLLSRDVAAFQPAWAAIGDEYQSSLRRACAGTETKVTTLEALASCDEADLILIATVGRAGLLPTLAALRAGKTVLLANKEVLSMAGEVVTATAREFGGRVMPVDSEHVALWQCLEGEQSNVRRLILTASGGALRDRQASELARITPSEALAHPTWKMGAKVTIDSATLFNKGLEVLEARWLFDVALEQIEVVLHRESIVHSLVEFADGSLKAQLAAPDMRLPIQYALSYPERWAQPWLSPLNIAQLGRLSFEPIDEARYPCFALAIEAARTGGTYPAVLCAVDEVAVSAFLAGQIRFMDIPALLEDALAAHHAVASPSLEAIIEADDWGRHWALQRISSKASQVVSVA